MSAAWMPGQALPEGMSVAEAVEAYLDHVDAEEARAEDCWCAQHGEEHDELCERRRHGDQ